MQNIVKKGLVVTVILLFIGVSFQPIIAKDTISPVKKSDTKELLETIKDIAGNEEIQKVIQKYENKKSLLGFKQQLIKLQKEIINVIERNDALNERIKQLSDLPCDCEKDNLNRLWPFPVICTFLFVLIFYCLWLVMRGDQWKAEKLAKLIGVLWVVFNCPDL